MSRFMLDTNMASYIIKENSPEVRQRLAMLPMDSIVVSVVTQAELLYGLARKGRPAALAKLIQAPCSGVTVGQQCRYGIRSVDVQASRISNWRPNARSAASMPSMRVVCRRLVKRLTSCGVVRSLRANSAGRTF